MTQCPPTRPGPVDPAPGDCAARCEHHAQGVLRACLATGHSQPDCEHKAAAALRECMAGCKPGSTEPPAPPTCQDKCERHAHALERACVEAGRDPAECAAEAATALHECLALCPTEPPPPDRCVLQCEAEAHAYYNTCMAQHHDAAGCAARARHILEVCKEGCVKEPGQQ